MDSEAGHHMTVLVDVKLLYRNCNVLQKSCAYTSVLCRRRSTHRGCTGEVMLVMQCSHKAGYEPSCDMRHTPGRLLPAAMPRPPLLPVPAALYLLTEQTPPAGGSEEDNDWATPPQPVLLRPLSVPQRHPPVTTNQAPETPPGLSEPTRNLDVAPASRRRACSMRYYQTFYAQLYLYLNKSLVRLRIAGNFTGVFSADLSDVVAVLPF